jgi:hypothetical protein
MAFDDIIPSHFPELYQTEWELDYQQMMDHVKQYVEVYPVQGDVRKFPRMGTLGTTKYTQRSDAGPGPRITNPDMGDTEIVSLFTDFYYADPIEVDRREAIKLGSIASPHSAFKRSQLAAMMRRVTKVIIDGVLGTRFLGKNGTTQESLPSSQLLSTFSTMSYDLLDEVYTQYGDAQVLGQHVDNVTNVTIICRHKDLKAFRNDANIKDSDFSDVRPIDRGTIYQWRDFTFVCVPGSQFTTITSGSDVDKVDLVCFARDAVAFGDTEAPFAGADVIPEWHRNVLLQLEAGFGCTRTNNEGVYALRVNA